MVSDHFHFDNCGKTLSGKEPEGIKGSSIGVFEAQILKGTYKLILCWTLARCKTSDEAIF
jgi:hypothetical protein